MDAISPAHESRVTTRAFSPLGLPPGSVRAIVALTVVAIYVIQTVRGESAGLLLLEALLIVVAHYFASRRVLALPQELKSRLEREGYYQAEANPLWLPRHSVRTLILAAIGLTTLALLLRGDLFQPGVFENLFVVLAYLIGVGFRQWRNGQASAHLPWRQRTWLHLKAASVLLACCIFALLASMHLLDTLAPLVEQVLLGWILFYFGSR